MTENQEKELFNTLATLVTEVRSVKSDVQDVKKTQSQHSRILNEHSQILTEHSRILNEHSQILNRLDAKTDSIAETVMANDKRLIAVEKDVSDLRSGIH
ncbi:MAG: hypothetical protein M3033_10180 [Acidobacteriota bacterium]|nr:hypothetical protein [Acidobacteriota bacterium]